MYPSNRLASLREADRSHRQPESFAQSVTNRWRDIITSELLPYAATLNNGQGMPVSIGEFGAVPFNLTAVAPASFQPSTDLDPQEQEAVILGLIRSVDQLGDEIPEITIWQWGIGDLEDRFGLNPCLLYTSPSPRDATLSRMPSSA